MLKLILLFLLLSTAGFTYSQNRVTDSSATCIAFWNNKESRVLEIKHIREKYDSLRLKSSSEVIYEAHMRILDSAGDGFKIEWIYKNFRSPGTSDKTLMEVNALMENVKILYKTDDVGSFSELLNWQEVRDFGFNTIEQMMKNQPDNKAIASALSQVKNMFASKESVEALMIKEIQLYHTPFGTEYSKRGVVTDVELPNVTGGSPFPAKITVKLNELNTKKDYCKVSLNQVIDKEKATGIIVEMLKKLSGSAGRNEEVNKKDIDDMEISDINEFTYSLSAGWLLNAFYKRTSTLGGVRQIETYVITEKK